jgi:hypothetical protein
MKMDNEIREHNNMSGGGLKAKMIPKYKDKDTILPDETKTNINKNYIKNKIEKEKNIKP